MGLLKDIQTRFGKVSYLRCESDNETERGSFDDVDLSVRPHGYEYWHSLREQGERELAIIPIAARKPGRPALLQTYKIYKKDFLRRWSNFVTERAATDNVTKDQLWMELGFMWDVELRELRRGATGKSRVTYDRYMKVLRPLVEKNGWHLMRHGCMTTIFSARLYSQEEFVEWVKSWESPTNLPHLKLVPKV